MVGLAAAKVLSLLYIAALLAGTSISEFRGASKLANSIKDETTQLLVYANNANVPGILKRGAILPLNLDTHLTLPGGCCSHRATPSLSPDARSIAYVHLSDGQPRREAVTIYNVEDQSQRAVFEAEVIWGISWAPGGERLALVADRAPDQGHNLYIVDLSSNAVTQLSHGTVHIDGNEYAISNHAPPSWNQVGSQLAVEVRSTHEQPENSAAGSIVLWDIEAHQLRKLTDGVDPAWSPAADGIAFFESSRQKCFTIRSDGSEKKLLFALGKRPFPSKSAPLFYPIVWSPDGKQLIFHQWVDADLITDTYRLDLVNGKLSFIGSSELQVVNWRTNTSTLITGKKSADQKPLSCGSTTRCSWAVSFSEAARRILAEGSMTMP